MATCLRKALASSQGAIFSVFTGAFFNAANSSDSCSRERPCCRKVNPHQRLDPNKSNSKAAAASHVCRRTGACSGITASRRRESACQSSPAVREDGRRERIFLPNWSKKLKSAMLCFLKSVRRRAVITTIQKTVGEGCLSDMIFNKTIRYEAGHAEGLKVCYPLFIPLCITQNPQCRLGWRIFSS